MKPDIPPIAVLPKCWLWGKCIHKTKNEKMTDDPYIKATSEKNTHRFPKIDDIERR